MKTDMNLDMVCKDCKRASWVMWVGIITEWEGFK